MKLLAIKSFDYQDPLPGLGEKKVTPPKPVVAPAPTPVAGNPQVVVGADGKMETRIPTPPALVAAYVQNLELLAARIYHAAFATAPIKPSLHNLPREELPYPRETKRALTLRYTKV